MKIGHIMILLILIL